MSRASSALALMFYAAILLPSAGLAAEDLISVQSPYSVEETMDRFESAAKAAGMTVFLRLDHAAAATKVGMSLSPTELLIFGNPKGGTALMGCARTIGIELPLKALAWENAAGQVELSYIDMQSVAARHDAGTCPAVKPIQSLLERVARSAVAGPN